MKTLTVIFALVTITVAPVFTTTDAGIFFGPAVDDKETLLESIKTAQNAAARATRKASAVRSKSSHLSESDDSLVAAMAELIGLEAIIAETVAEYAEEQVSFAIISVNDGNFAYAADLLHEAAAALSRHADDKSLGYEFATASEKCATAATLADKLAAQKN